MARILVISKISSLFTLSRNIYCQTNSVTNQASEETTLRQILIKIGELVNFGLKPPNLVYIYVFFQYLK